MVKTQAAFLALVKQVSLVRMNLTLLGWDARTYLPPAGTDFRGELTATLSAQDLALSAGLEMGEFVAYFTAHPDELDTQSQQVLRLVKRDYELNHEIAPADYADYQQTLTHAQGVWETARAAQDFSLLQPDLVKIVAQQKAFIPKWRHGQATDYDVLLDLYEPGMTVAQLDPIMATLKAGIHRLRERLQTQGVTPRDAFMSRAVPEDVQEQLVRTVVQRLGYDFTKGDLSRSTHPFTVSLDRNDVRITNRYDEHAFQMAFLGGIHEAGHGLYMQNFNPAYDYTPLADAPSMGLHESQSLFNEIFLARNPAFWQGEYPRFQAATGDIFADIDEPTFYRGFMTTEPTLIRTEADPLTYPLHIIVRYELEKGLFNGDTTVAELPDLWRQKYHDYLGIEPDNDTDGILQDIHWAGGDFGYFPTYLLGQLYAAQFYHTMCQELPVTAILRSGDYQPITQWRREKIHWLGASLTPNQLCEQVTGEPLNPQYWLDWMTQTFETAYQVTDK
ncbi:carboxypeptidase M32 [Levilactobacillus suantsaiihabitans]|uniref:Metal-dependent carboxypeptidase n=1 Tax=Levilactobacillus suantsaiihabitans TaxID=2487722 RepID=A0A4Z0J8I1_9LACO|nr:carboxypeptidase M32 [Levilactobacillus suantsaiihabitans]TGD19020.1 carboxypeptidase M32 [Levilactobacillus suantsaiihabitans]